MPIFHAIVLGVVQGLTEFLPISSSGHLIFIPKLLGWPDQGIVFDLIVHLGSLAAVLYYLRSTIGEIFLSFFREGSHHDSNRRLGWLVLASAIPAGIVGFFAGDWIEATFRSPISVAGNLIFWGLILWLADVANRARQAMGKTRPLSLLKLKDSIVIGMMQILALFPGVSRSGITITAGSPMSRPVRDSCRSNDRAEPAALFAAWLQRKVRAFFFGVALSVLLRYCNELLCFIYFASITV